MKTRPESFDKNLLEIQSVLRKIASTLCKTTNEREDLVQEVNARALNYAHLFEEGTNFKGWIVTMMYNHYKSAFYKKKKRYNECFVEDVNMDDHEAGGNPEETLSWKQQWEKIVPHLGDPGWQYLWEYRGRGTERDYDYVAKKFNVPIGTVKSRIFKFRAKVAKELAD